MSAGMTNRGGTVRRAALAVCLGLARVAPVQQPQGMARAAASSTWSWQNPPPGASAVGSLDARDQTGVSLARGWQHLPLVVPRISPDALQVNGGLQIVTGGPGLMIFSRALGADTPASLWSSADAREWKPTPLPRRQSGERFDHFYAASQLLILTGCAQCAFSAPPPTPSVPVPRIWFSADGGTTWHLSPAELGITALAAGGDGVVAFADDFAPSAERTTVWTSADGLTWRQLPAADAVFGSGAEVLSVTRSGAGLVAGGGVGPRAAIWTSPDGLTWTEAPNDGNVFGKSVGGSDIEAVVRVVAGPQGVLALGQTQSSAPEGVGAAWVSPDGIHWRRADTLPFSETDIYAGRVAAWPGGFVGLVDEAGETAVWFSPGGLTWTRVGSDELFGGSARVDSVTSFDGGVAAVGTFAHHPRPACLQDPYDDPRVFGAATLLWNPEESKTAAPPTIDHTDPRTLKLLAADFPSGLRTHFSPVISGMYVDLCPQLPILGRHRAYRLLFAPGDGEALSIVTQSVKAARNAFRHVDRLLSSFSYRTLGIATRVRIGEETRVFKVRRGQPDCPSDGNVSYYTASAVVWRQGRVIGAVMSAATLPCPSGESGGLNLNIWLAREQLAHLQHPVIRSPGSLPNKLASLPTADTRDHLLACARAPVRLRSGVRRRTSAMTVAGMSIGLKCEAGTTVSSSTRSRWKWSPTSVRRRTSAIALDSLRPMSRWPHNTSRYDASKSSHCSPLSRHPEP